MRLDRAAESPIPITRSDERLAYEVTVTNVAGTNPSVGSQLRCEGTPAEGVNWVGTPAPSFRYRWLRDGTPIAGAEGPWPATPAMPTYTLTAADEGESIQCEVIGTNDPDEGATPSTYDPISAVAISQPPLVVEPNPAPAAPSAVKSQPGVSSTSRELGGFLTCTAPTEEWSGSPTWTLTWLRNGEPAPHGALEETATTSKYELKAEDVNPPAAFQCLAIASNAGGSAASVSGTRIRTKPEPAVTGYEAPFTGTLANAGKHGAIAFDNSSSGPVTVQVALPPRTLPLQARGSEGAKVWKCTKTPPTGLVPAGARCTREDTLSPQHAYPTIELIAQVRGDAPDPMVTQACVSGGGALVESCQGDTVGGLLPAVPFDFATFQSFASDEGGGEFTQAGGHPFAAGASLRFTEHIKPEWNAESKFRAANGWSRVIRTEVPPGFVGNPEAAVKCPSLADVLARPSTCPVASAVGEISFKTSTGEYEHQPIYAIEPEAGTPAQFAFGVTALAPGFGFTLTPELDPKRGYAVNLVASPNPRFPELFEAEVTLCNRGAELENIASAGGETKFVRCWDRSDSQAFEKPFLTLPTKCGDPESATTRIFADTWEHPGDYANAQYTINAPEGCEGLEFEPDLETKPTTDAADSPSGLDVTLDFPQNEDPEGLATAQLKKTVLTLPEGMTVNPSAANGLGACSPSQVGLGTNDPVSCPDSSKIGAVTAHTPILDHSLPGTLYIATPHDNPFGALLALYLVVEDPQTGIVVKLPGRTDADPNTGRLTTTFDENPQAPIDHVEVHLRAGATAPLRTPPTCGNYRTDAELTPWSAPQSGPPAAVLDKWQIRHGSSGGACFAKPPLSASFEAGSASPIAAATSPFGVHISRPDGSQELQGVSVTMPPGLAAYLTGVATCSDSALAAAEAKSGHEEQQSPSCPADSKVGSVTAGAGAGPKPYYAQGAAYLAGPYKGAPLSLAVITPAVAGPFDLGNVVVRVALRIDPVTAQVSAVSDPLPRILEGIPLDVRTIDVSIDRPHFTLNPTSCEEMQIEGSLSSTSGESMPLKQRFQLGECARLKLKPHLSLRLKGGHKRAANPKLIANLTQPAGSTNLASLSVRLPRAAFLDQSHIRTICTRVQWAADACPPGSVYGNVWVKTPLLDYTLKGHVYLRSSSHKLPDLVTDLRGPDYQPIRVELSGKTDSVKGALRNTFQTIPDAPFTRAHLVLFGGKRGLVVNSRNVCAHTFRAIIEAGGQNGKAATLRPKVNYGCKKAKRKRHAKHRRRHG